MSWNGYPFFTSNFIIKQLKTSPKNFGKEKDDRKIVWIRLPYLGNIGDRLKKNCYKKVQKCLKVNVCFITCYETKRAALFCSAKDNIRIHQKANVICKATYPGCNEDYVGKTDLNLVQFVIFKPLSYCFEESIRFNVKASFLSRPLSRLIRWYNKPRDITTQFWEKAIQFHGTFWWLENYKLSYEIK